MSFVDQRKYESIHVNISLIRKRIRNQHLVTEVQHVGQRSKQDVQLVYIDDLVNEQLLKISSRVIK